MSISGDTAPSDRVFPQADQQVKLQMDSKRSDTSVHICTAVKSPESTLVYIRVCLCTQLSVLHMCGKLFPLEGHLSHPIDTVGVSLCISGTPPIDLCDRTRTLRN